MLAGTSLDMCIAVNTGLPPPWIRRLDDAGSALPTLVPAGSGSASTCGDLFAGAGSGLLLIGSSVSTFGIG